MKPIMLFAGAAVVMVLPLAYLSFRAMNSNDGPKMIFHRTALTPLDPADGKFTVPTPAEEKKGASLEVEFSPAFLKKITGKTPPSAKAFALSITAVSEKTANCLDTGAAPPSGNFGLQAKCETELFNSKAKPAGSSLFIDQDHQLIAYLSNGNTHQRVFHNNWVATFDAEPTMQGDMKKNTCFAKAALDYIFKAGKTDPSICAAVNG